MKTIGHPVVVVDDETGEEFEYRLIDTPMNRAIHAADTVCAGYGLDQEERLAVGAFVFGYRKDLVGAPLRSFSGRAWRDGLNKLIARGWMVIETKHNRRKIVHA